jgi:putative ABC transport system permease protein
MNFGDVFSLAYRTVRSNKLRTGLTVAIIAFGIMALIGIITAITAMNQKLTESFSSMGANGFTIRFKERQIRFGGGGSDLQLEKKGAKKEKKSNLNKRITIKEAEAFKKNYHFPASASISVFANRNTLLSYDTRKTSPNVLLLGGDENYLLLNGFKLQAGRNMNNVDVLSGRNVCIIGSSVASSLFKGSPEKAINSIVRLNNLPFRVLGVLQSKGSSFGFNRDNVVITSYRNVDRNFPPSFSSYSIGIMTDDIKQLDNAIGEADAVFRAVRKLIVTEQDNFILDRSDSIAEKAMNSLGFLTVSATVIGLITLIGAAIGLMNIMLVSVTERTKEVGLVKAIGGKSKMVRQQFLTEAVIISIMGAFFGIILGILVGNLFSIVLGTGFVVPWRWVLYGILICTAVGLGAGLYPALKAGKLNPIEALRYE